MSQRIASLEQEIGKGLILRTRGVRGIALTDAGHAFLDLAERWMQIEIEAEQLGRRHDRRIALGLVDSLSIYVLPDFLGRLASAAPPLHLHVETGRFWQLHDRVATGHLHCAFTLNPAEHIDLITQEIAHFPMAVATMHPIGTAGATAIDIDSLSAEDELTVEWSQEIDRWRSGHRRERGAGFVDKAHLLLPLLKRPASWALVPRFMEKLLGRDGTIRLHPLSAPPPPLRMFLVRRRKDLTFGATELATIREALRACGFGVADMAT